MFKTNIKLSLMLIMTLMGFDVQAIVSPVVIETVFEMGAWRPLPKEKIIAASADTALSEISKSKQFAFFTSTQPDMKAGTLRITIHLVEEAETATVSIILQQLNGISISSTHSESLQSQSYDGIYKKFQAAGRLAGQKLVKTLKSQSGPPKRRVIASQDRNRVKYLEDQIISINNKIRSQTGNRTIRSEAKLEHILNELKSIKISYTDLAKKEDIHKQGVKIDKVLDEVGRLSKKIDDKPVTQINVKQSYVIENPLMGQSKIPVSTKMGHDEGNARQLYDEAQNLKQNKNYRKAEDKLQHALRLATSSGLSSLVLDELNYGLPMFEAQATAIELGGNFQAYAKKNQHTKMLDRITTLYKNALKNNKQNFQRTRTIQAALDQHLNTRQAMASAMSAQNKMDGHAVNRYMEMELMMRGEYPDKKQFGKLLKRYNLRYKVLAYQSSDDKYNAILQANAGGILNIRIDENGELTIE
jgi:hypothetical protein